MQLHQLCSPFLSAFLLEQFGSIDLTETRATCDNCVCSQPQRGNLPFYQSDLKCCTFHPFLPNYTVGALLKNSGTPAFIQTQLRSKIKARDYALPLGIFAPLNYQIQFNNRDENDFGNKKNFLCPYFNHQTKNCGIWLHRGAVCTSYYCVSDRGEKGLKLWENLGEYLHLCEMVLSQDALVSMGLSPDIIENQLEYVNCMNGTEEEMTTSSMSQALFEDYWKDWIPHDSIESFYINCSKYISSLTTAQIKTLLEEETQELESQLQSLFESIKDSPSGEPPPE